jgi:hypothetical protein
LSYADDVVLIAPTEFAMRRMLSLCDQLASEYRTNFIPQKSKCVVLLPKGRKFLAPYLKDHQFSIGGQPMEFVDSYRHLDHIINSQFTDDDDINKRKADFIGQVNNLLCHFRAVYPAVKCKLFFLTAVAFLVANCGHWIMIGSVTYVPHGVKVFAGSGTSQTPPIVFSCHNCVIACLFTRNFAGAH